MIIIVIFLLSNIILGNQSYIIEYPLPNKFEISAIKLEKIDIKPITYKIDYTSFFITCVNKKNKYIGSYIDCNSQKNKKIKDYEKFYGKKLINILKREKNFYVAYKSRKIKDYEKILIKLKEKFEIFISRKKEILFFSKKSINTTSQPVLKYVNFLNFNLTLLNIIIYLYKNNVKFRIQDIKINNSKIIFKNKFSQKYYNNHFTNISGYIISTNYIFYHNNFKINRSFNLIVEKSTNKILYLYINDIFINKNL